ncbi:50S ribosomal protein L34e [Candidatus Woesearchaeota archaeon]|nr:50S ribosomal protein L34e [Candidatus Woesearchaeota archaeon]
MPEGRLKSRTFRRIKKKLPGGKTVLHYKKRQPSRAKCGKCGSILKGVEIAQPKKIQKMTKTKKRPERPFGGVLCSKCLREKTKKEARV